jgi:predicted ATP-grasp superfamily ATP-dependent carboligase
VVIGLCKHGLFLTRTFARHGVPVVALESDPKRSSARTRYGRKVWCASLEDERLVSALERLKDDLDRPAPLFPTNDRIVDALIAHWERLGDAYLLPFGPDDRLIDLKDKGRLHQLAVSYGFDVPVTLVVRTPEDVYRLPEAVTFPVAVKPAWPMGSFKVRRCGSVEEILALTVRNGSIAEPVVVQEWLPGDERALVFGAYYIAPDGRCAARYGGGKILAFPDVSGHSIACASRDIPELVERGYAFLRDAGYWGLGSIEYKLDPGGRARFIEVTVGRTDWWAMCCAVNGVNLPMAAYQDLTGAGLRYANRQRARYVWHDLEGELFVIPRKLRSRAWSAGDLLRYLLRRKKDALFDWRDPRPFWSFVRQFVRSRLRGAGGK